MGGGSYKLVLVPPCGLEWEWEWGRAGGGNGLFWGAGNGEGAEVGMLLCWAGMAWLADGLEWE